MSTTLVDVGIAIEGEVLTHGVHWTLGDAGLHRVSPGPAADAVAAVLAREHRDGLRVWGRITRDGLDWRIRPPATRVKARRRMATEEVLTVLMGGLRPRELLDTFSAGGGRDALRERAIATMARLGLDVPLDGQLAALDPAERSALELLHATLAQPPLLWVDDPALLEHPALDVIAEERPVVVAGARSGARELALPAAGGDAPPAPPRWFRWVIDRQLGGMRRPGGMGELDLDVAALRALGVSRVIGLEEEPVAADAIRDAAIGYAHFPIVDMEAPSLAPTRTLVRETLDRIDAGERVVFHCKAGLGRTGTMLCACLLERGYGLNQALGFLRQLRAEYVQSDAQVQMLRRYADESRR